MTKRAKIVKQGILKITTENKYSGRNYNGLEKVPCVKGLEWPAKRLDLSLIQYRQDELKLKLQVRPDHSERDKNGVPAQSVVSVVMVEYDCSVVE